MHTALRSRFGIPEAPQVGNTSEFNWFTAASSCQASSGTWIARIVSPRLLFTRLPSETRLQEGNPPFGWTNDIGASLWHVGNTYAGSACTMHLPNVWCLSLWLSCVPIPTCHWLSVPPSAIPPSFPSCCLGLNFGMTYAAVCITTAP